jgi:hypothetical protein
MEAKIDRRTTTRLKGALGSKSETWKPMQKITVPARNVGPDYPDGSLFRSTFLSSNAVACAAGDVFSAPLEHTTDEQWANSIKAKGMGQINLVRAPPWRIRDQEQECVTFHPGPDFCKRVPDWPDAHLLRSLRPDRSLATRPQEQSGRCETRAS